ncbi:hypothetical protein [Geoalkalibacter subterraneus]|uniref:hypothetical protein n=1 Tax=Geoalkalibacter subterraneus TaxID=483547 RepID=UPI0009FE0B4A|nr:hypothetical protein [Geoalkalibacter subterraneus]
MNPVDVHTRDAQLWESGLAALRSDWACLADEEKSWIVTRLDAVERLQQGLHRLFVEGEGEEHCRKCGGLCCGHGKHHVTLVNLLFFISRNSDPPSPDFSATCPMLAAEGCRLSPGTRPFNCVTFACDSIEENMSSDARAAFYAAERSLRHLYDEFAQRYAGAGMRGFLLARARLDGGSSLQRLDISPADAGI